MKYTTREVKGKDLRVGDEVEFRETYIIAAQVNIDAINSSDYTRERIYKVRTPILTEDKSLKVKQRVEALVNKRFANYVHCTSIDGSTGIRNMLVHEIMTLYLEGYEEFEKATAFLR